MKDIKILLADDHELVLEGLTALIQSMEGFVLCGKATTGEGLLKLLTHADELPDICVLDIEMPGIGGFGTLKIIKEKFPTIKVLVLTMHDEPYYINRVIKERADAYLLKNLNRESFLQSLHKIARSEPFFIQRNVPEKETPLQHVTKELTAREKHILRLIAHGKSNKQIGEELSISNRTVDTHRTNLMRKLGVSSSVQLVHYAYNHNLL